MQAHLNTCINLRRMTSECKTQKLASMHTHTHTFTQCETTANFMWYDCNNFYGLRLERNIQTVNSDMK